MKLLLGLQRLLPENAGAGGAGRYVGALLRYLPEFAEVRAVVVPGNETMKAHFPDVDFFPRAACNYEDMQDLFDWCDCYFDPLNGLRPVYIPDNIPVMCCVHDLQHMHLPEFFSENELIARVREYGYAIERADCLVAISKFEQMNFERFYGTHKAKVVYSSGFLADDLMVEVANGNTNPELNLGEYFVFPGVPWLHKNHAALVQALALFNRYFCATAPVGLVLTNIGSHVANGTRLRRLAQRLGVSDLITFENFVPEKRLLELLLGSVGVTFPSLYEGYGIPLVDAMKLGIPIIAGRSAAVPEVCGDACMYFRNPYNPLTMAEDLAVFRSDLLQRQRLISRGFERGREFSTRKMAAGIANLARGLIERGRAENRGAITRPYAVQQSIDNMLNRHLLSVHIVLREENADALIALLGEGQEDLSTIYSKHFPPDTEFSFSVDLALFDITVIRKLFGNSERICIFDSGSADSMDLAVQYFSITLAKASYQLVTTHMSAQTYTPTSVKEAVSALDLFPDRLYASFDDSKPFLYVSNSLDEEGAALAFDRRSQSQKVVLDAIIRQEVITRVGANGSAKLLSHLLTSNGPVVVPRRVAR